MERMIKLHVEKLPEGVYLATSDDVQGLIAQGRTVSETIEIARDVARKLIEARSERAKDINLSAVRDSFDYPNCDRLTMGRLDCSARFILICFFICFKQRVYSCLITSSLVFKPR
jgi:predicted RNase H-like HicB family nuclease